MTEVKAADAKRYYENLKIEAIVDKEFDIKGENEAAKTLKLIPIIFSHGFLGNATSVSRHCLELASHGYIVFSMDHMDGSCGYTEKKDGSPFKFHFNKGFYEIPYRKN
jgi:cephalosporin-C deacetylase-like acetyl esterase